MRRVAAPPDIEQELHPMTEQRRPSELSEEQLAEAEVQADVTDADIEEYAEPVPVTALEPEPAELSDTELAEADAESDLES
jgi:hypothetical protein